VTELRRHALVWLSHAPEAAHEPERSLVERWHAGGRPFVVCRRRSHRGDLSLGFCSPYPGAPERRPRRVAAHALRTQVLRADRPPALEEVARCHPAAGHADALSRLAAAAASAGLDVRVFGSWMWQALTGEPHVRASSDLDVLIEVSSAPEAERAVAFLEREARELPFAIDGELSVPGLGELHWREYRGDGAEVLLKSVADVRLMRREELWS